MFEGTHKIESSSSQCASSSSDIWIMPHLADAEMVKRPCFRSGAALRQCNVETRFCTMIPHLYKDQDGFLFSPPPSSHYFTHLCFFILGIFKIELVTSMEKVTLDIDIQQH